MEEIVTKTMETIRNVATDRYQERGDLCLRGQHHIVRVEDMAHSGQQQLKTGSVARLAGLARSADYT